MSQSCGKDRKAPEKENTKYEPLPGGGRDWNGDKDTGITIKVPEEVGKIIKVTVDGKELNGDDYTVTGNPPVVTLKPEFLKTLGDGTHTVLIQRENGYVETAFTVKESETDKKTDTMEKPTSSSGQSKGAKTGDETNVVSWTAVMLLALGVLLAAGIRHQRKAKRQ